MTILQLHALCHYSDEGADDFEYARWGDCSSYVEQLEELVKHGLLTHNAVDSIERDPVYAITDKGRAHLKHCSHVRLPVQVTDWVLP